MLKQPCVITHLDVTAKPLDVFTRVHSMFLGSLPYAPVISARCRGARSIQTIHCWGLCILFSFRCSFRGPTVAVTCLNFQR